MRCGSFKYCLLIWTALLGCRDKPAVNTAAIRHYIIQLDLSDRVITGGVGFTGKDNPTADAYKSLLQIAPDSVWVRLSYSEKAVVRMYAFEALHSKNSPELEEVTSRLKTDTAVVCEVSGDLEITTSIAQFVSMVRRRKDKGKD